jgi:hypothetical protein
VAIWNCPNQVGQFLQLPVFMMLLAVALALAQIGFVNY